jgi:hypothetical protein
VITTDTCLSAGQPPFRIVADSLIVGKLRAVNPEHAAEESRYRNGHDGFYPAFTYSGFMDRGIAAADVKKNQCGVGAAAKVILRNHIGKTKKAANGRKPSKNIRKHRCTLYGFSACLHFATGFNIFSSALSSTPCLSERTIFA